jgi:TonB family protein
MLMAYAIPPDARSVSLDLFQSNWRLIPALIKPPEKEALEVPTWLQKKDTSLQGGKGKRHQGDEGKAGKKDSKNKTGLYAIVGPQNNPDPHLAKKLAEDKAKNAGILGVLNMNQGSHMASIFGRETASGMDEANVLGSLVGDRIGEAYGIGGLSMIGTGSGGGGAGQGTVGLDRYGTFGKGGGGGDGSGYGRGSGVLKNRRMHGIDIIPGIANVRGSLDKEIIRRIIRRHMNEVKFCYEQELTKKSNLAGRLAVQFTIAASGEVLTSVLQSSTMGNISVENCVVKAVRRWEFPKPNGGGLVIVSYPFNFMSGGAGS